MPAQWFKPEDPVYREWFAPLEALAVEVAKDPTLPAVRPDHFLYAACIQRKGFPDLRVYRHVGSRRYLNVDDRGLVWRYTASDQVGAERYAPTTVEAALESAELFRGNLIVGHLRACAVIGPPPGPSPAADDTDPDSPIVDDVPIRGPALDDGERVEAGFDADAAPDRADAIRIAV